jgi:hypothetical protein
MGIHQISIDGLLKAMPQKKQRRLRQRILKLIDAFEQGDDPPRGGNVQSLKAARETKRNGITQLIRGK